MRGQITVFLLTLALASACFAQPVSSLTCVASAVPALVRQEGLAERVGDVLLNCSGGLAGGTISANLTVFLTTNVTNKLASNNTVDAFLTVDTGSGPRSTGATASLGAANMIVFSGMNFNLSPTGSATLRISNVRAAMGLVQGQTVNALLSTNGPSSITIQNSPQTVAIPSRGLLANYSTTYVCTASKLPDSITFTSLLAGGVRFASARVTEGSPDAFQVRGSNSDNGTRIFVRFGGFPAGARLFIPDVVAGSSATKPTAGGDLGVAASGGEYTPGPNGSLLLVRIRNTAKDGSGGLPAFTPPPPGSGVVRFDAVSEVDLSAGSGIAAYEVADSNASVRESAQFPVFLALATRPEGPAVRAEMSVSFGPVSNEGTASTTAPVPRFLAAAPPSDCTALGDCDASYLPRLLVGATAPLQFTAIAGSAFQTKYVQVRNDGGGLLNWNAFVSYQTGSNWVTLDPEYGFNGGTVRIDVLPMKLSPGRYDALLIIDAGPLSGSKSLPITLIVTELPVIPPPPPQLPEIRSVTSAASGDMPLLVAGSLATIWGSRFQGTKVDVTFDGQPARILYRDDRQINVEVPAALGVRGSAQLLVSVDGRTSAPRPVQLVLAAPAIFPGAILNQDNTPNSATNPATAGSIIQIFLTGLPTASVSARVGQREITSLYYAGPAPGIPGLQQVNLAIPEDLGAATVDLRVCGYGICSPAHPLTIAP